MATEEYDVVVVGAGLYGISFARVYLDVHPTCRLIIIDRDSCAGGVWNDRRLYDTFWSQIGMGMAEFSDMPMERPPAVHQEFPEAKYVTKYLEDYCRNHIYNGKTIQERMIFKCAAQSVERTGTGWKIHAVKDGATSAEFQTKKLIVATGLTSTPNLPKFPHEERFQGPIVHQESFGESPVLSSPDIKHVSVLGGAKSAADMAYAAVKAGKSVSWIIRESGAGPAAFVSAEGKGMYKNSAELGSTRLFGMMSPSYYSSDNWWIRFFNCNSCGRWLTSKLWSSANTLARAVFNGNTKALDGFQNLSPSTNVFWCNDSLGLIQHPDFWPTIAENVNIHRGDIASMSEKSLTLSNGTEIDSDALCCGTGWKRSHQLFSKSQLIELGLPHDVSDDPQDEAEWWSSAIEKATPEVLSRYPALANPPPHFPKPKLSTPYRLLNCIAPLSEASTDNHSTVFVGHIHVPNSFRGAEVQAIWATAYLDNNVSLPSLGEMKDTIAYVTAWNQRRYLNNGRLGNYLHYDMVGYTDKLLADLGLSSHWKGSFWEDYIVPCFMYDLRGCVPEYLQKYGREKGRFLYSHDTKVDL